MGNFGEDWSEGNQELLVDRFIKFAEGADFKEHYEFSEIVYNNLFDERRDAWGNKAKEIAGVFAR